MWTEGNISCKVGHSKGQEWMNLTEAEEIQKRCWEYTEELYKKDLNEPDYYDDVISHPDPYILECEDKWP